MAAVTDVATEKDKKTVAKRTIDYTAAKVALFRSDFFLNRPK
jgi:hypothetical protein